MLIVQTEQNLSRRVNHNNTNLSRIRHDHNLVIWPDLRIKSIGNYGYSRHWGLKGFPLELHIDGGLLDGYLARGILGSKCLAHTENARKVRVRYVTVRGRHDTATGRLIYIRLNVN